MNFTTTPPRGVSVIFLSLQPLSPIRVTHCHREISKMPFLLPGLSTLPCPDASLAQLSAITDHARISRSQFLAQKLRLFSRLIFIGVPMLLVSLQVGIDVKLKPIFFVFGLTLSTQLLTLPQQGGPMLAVQLDVSPDSHDWPFSLRRLGRPCKTAGVREMVLDKLRKVRGFCILLCQKDFSSGS